MSSEITTAFVKQFGANVFHLSQQKGSRLRGAVRTEPVIGDARYFDRIGKAVAQTKTGRHQDTPILNTPHSRRMVTLVTKEYGDMVDKADKIRTLNDPTNDYSMAAQWALGRAMDQAIVDAATGTAYSGVAGATTVSLPTTQKLMSCNSAGTAGAYLNVQALRRSGKILDANEVGDEIQRFFAFNATQKEALLSETEVTSSDFNTIKALVAGKIDEFMGFKFIRLELLNDQSGAILFNPATGLYDNTTIDADGYDLCLAWGKDGLLLGLGQDIVARIAERADKSFGVQVYASMDIGATRMEEEKVVAVHCKDT